MGHVVLLGDSIFDNAAYVPGGPSVLDHLRRTLPRGWEATLLAVDGSVAAGVSRQLQRLPRDATHLVVSTGGNDALGYAAEIFNESTSTSIEVLTQLADIRAEFQAEYRGMLEEVLGYGKPTAACTIYDAVPGLERGAQAGLCLFNDVILVEAARAGVPVLDLRLVCNEATDYSPVSPIEPSAAGGDKIARVVAKLVTEHDFEAGGCRIYA